MRRPARRTARRTSRRTARRVVRRTRRRMIRRTVLVGGMVVLAAQGTANAIKLSQQDAKRIEDHTGLPPQELEDQDLEAAMQELSIKPQPVTPQDEAAINQAGTQAQTPPPATEKATAQVQDVYAEIEKLAELRDKGILTEEEFEAKKRQLLGI
jgi:hypothetical protein